MAEKLDPYDVGALEKSLNDSATRVSTIWVSFLIFSLYLVVAAGGIEHRQLFLAEAVKLPVLNIELPLIGFFVLAPVLFVIFHVYVLLQVLFLGRTAAAYNKAIEQAVKRGYLAPEEEASLRQRLANTLFTQIFAGSPREGGGWIGLFLNIMAWITLAIAPIFVLLMFQFGFLPYHSHGATWTHRLLTAVELLAFFLLWPLALDPRQDFAWPKIWSWLKRACTAPRRLLGPPDGRREERAWLRQQAAPVAASLLFVIVSLSLMTFPGEWHVNLLTGQSLASVQCDRWLHGAIDADGRRRRGLLDGLEWRVDRLFLPRVDVVDDEKLKKIEEATKAAGDPPYQGERTQKLRGRDLNCGDFSDFADLRRVDLAGAQLANADFRSAKLQGASLTGAQLQGASLTGAQLQGAFLLGAQLQGASLGGAQLQGAFLVGAQLQGASLLFAKLQGASVASAQLQGASLGGAQLQGASLGGAQLQGASLAGAELQGASLTGAQLQGASLAGAQLQGAFLLGAQLQGASLGDAQLQGADLHWSSMNHTHFSNVRVWRAQNADCAPSRVNGHKSDAIVAVIRVFDRPDESIRAEPSEIAKFIERSVADIPDARGKEDARERMRAGLDPTKGDAAAIAATWSECEAASAKPSRQEFDRKFDQDHAQFLSKLVCDDTRNGRAVVHGIIRNWISDNAARRAFSTQLARGLRGQDGRECPGAKDLDQGDMERLRKFAPDSPAAPATPPIPQ